jgi:indolepyruvate ferredoxin oxidoreductase beta subunit
MISDIIIAGTGGQGVLTSAAVLTLSAMKEDFNVSQSEVHGIAQRGGSVVAQVRISDATIHCSQISRGMADLVIGMEVLEGLRYVSWLRKNGSYIATDSFMEPFAGYPDRPFIQQQLQCIPHKLLIATERISVEQTGSKRAANMVLIGAASMLLTTVTIEAFEKTIEELFSRKGTGAVEGNLKAFIAGRELV